MVSQLVKAMTKKRIQVDGGPQAADGPCFQGKLPDLHNTRVVDIVKELKEHNY